MGNSGERASNAASEAAAPLVLVIEDDPRVRALVRSMLQSCGYRVIEAANGNEALAQFNRHRAGLALVVSDVVMPDTNGIVLAARMRSLGNVAPTLFMSGYADRTLQSRGLSDGTLRVLRKPFTLAQLSERVEELLSPAEH